MKFEWVSIIWNFCSPQHCIQRENYYPTRIKKKSTNYRCMSIELHRSQFHSIWSCFFYSLFVSQYFDSIHANCNSSAIVNVFVSIFYLLHDSIVYIFFHSKPKIWYTRTILFCCPWMTEKGLSNVHNLLIMKFMIINIIFELSTNTFDNIGEKRKLP